MRFKYLSVFYCILINYLSGGQNINATTVFPKEVTTKTQNADSTPIPLCCPINETYDVNHVCRKSDIPFKLSLEIFRSNDTYFFKYLNRNVKPYHRKLNCLSYLYDDINVIATNTSGTFLVNQDGITNEFCIDNDYNEISNISTSIAYICYHPELTRDPILYAMFISVSSLSAIVLALGAAAYFWVLTYEDIHRQCILVYFITQLFTIVSQLFVLVPVTGLCITIGYFFQIFYMMSMTWLGVLCFDVFYTVRYFNEDTSKSKRLYWYAASSITVILISFAVTITKDAPCIPNSFLKIQNSPVEMMCSLGDTCNETRFFYIPLIELILCIISLIVTFIMIFRKPSNNRTIRYDYVWLENNGTYKSMFRQNMFHILISVIVLAIQFATDSITLITMIFPFQCILLVVVYACDRKFINEFMAKISRVCRYQISQTVLVQSQCSSIAFKNMPSETAPEE